MSSEFEVDAALRWNDTGVDVLKGQQVEISASGQWTDSFITCGPDGFTRPWLRPVGWTRRYARAPWFALVAVIGKFDGPYNRIGSHGSFAAERTGRLYLFANDAWLFYYNNKGTLHVSIDCR